MNVIKIITLIKIIIIVSFKNHQSFVAREVKLDELSLLKMCSIVVLLPLSRKVVLILRSTDLIR